MGVLMVGRICGTCGERGHDKRTCARKPTVTCGKCGRASRRGDEHEPGCPRLEEPPEFATLTMDQVVGLASRAGGKDRVRKWLAQAETELERTRQEIRILKQDEANQMTRKAFLVNLLNSAAD